MISPLAADDLGVLVHLRARGYQVMVVSPNPVLFETARLSPRAEVRQAARVLHLERDLLIKHLRRAGIQTLDWDVSRPFDQAVRQSLARTPGYAQAPGRWLP